MDPSKKKQKVVDAKPIQVSADTLERLKKAKASHGDRNIDATVRRLSFGDFDEGAPQAGVLREEEDSVPEEDEAEDERVPQGLFERHVYRNTKALKHLTGLRREAYTWVREKLAAAVGFFFFFAIFSVMSSVAMGS